MAVGVVIAKGGVEYNGRLTPYVVLVSLISSMGGSIFGYDVGISGGVTSMVPFLHKFFPRVLRNMAARTKVSTYCRYNDQALAAFTSSLYIAALLSSIFASKVTRDFGRKTSTLVAGCLFIAGSIFTGVASKVSMLLTGRILLGIGLGLSTQSLPVYISEMSPAKYRGGLNAIFSFGVAIGTLAASLVNYGTQKIHSNWGWRISLVLVVVPSLILTIGMIFLPDSPNSIIQRTNNRTEAEAVLKKIRGVDNVERELEDIIEANETSKKIPRSFFVIFQRKYRPQLTMALLFPLFLVMTGAVNIGFYAPILLMALGESISTSLLLTAIIIGVLTSLFTAAGIAAIDKLGRRPLLMSGSVIILACAILIGGILSSKLPDYGIIEKRYAYSVICLMSLFIAGFSWSWGVTGFLVPSEVLPLEVRSTGQSMAISMSFLAIFAMSQSFLSMLCHMKAAVFFFYAGWIVLMTIFVVFLVPETANVPIEKMTSIWGNHWYWKKFVERDNEKV